MRRRVAHGVEEDDINMTPMLDIVFIMLIFFIVTASFVKEAGVDVNRTTAMQAQPMPRANILIAINEEGQIWIDKRKSDPRTIRANIERLLAENPEGSVVIQADKNSKNSLMIAVMKAAHAAGVESVSISAKRMQ